MGVGRLDIRVREFPGELRGTDMNWKVLHILQSGFLILVALVGF